MGAVDDQPQLKSARLERYLACVPGGLAGYPAARTHLGNDHLAGVDSNADLDADTELALDLR